MATDPKPHDEQSPLDLLTELAVEGTSSLVETQRALLTLAQQENDIILNGVKERVGGFLPAVAMTDLVRRSLDTLFGMQQELLTSTSRQTLQWLESEKAGKSKRATQLVEFAREGVETFARAQKKLLDVAAQESAKATSGKIEGDSKPAKKTEVAQLARDAGNAFIEAQKRILDVMGQQMNVNLDATTRAMKIVSPARLVPIATRTGEGVKSFMQKETSLIESLLKPTKIKPPKKIVRHGRVRAARPHKVVPA